MPVCTIIWVWRNFCVFYIINVLKVVRYFASKKKKFRQSTIISPKTFTNTVALIELTQPKAAAICL